MKCDDLNDEESEQADDCALEIILREIINNQNAQIQAMRAILEAKDYPQENDCKVPIGSESLTGDVTDKEFASVSLGTSSAIQDANNGAAAVTFLSTAFMMFVVYLS